MPVGCSAAAGFDQSDTDDEREMIAFRDGSWWMKHRNDGRELFFLIDIFFVDAMVKLAFL